MQVGNIKFTTRNINVNGTHLQGVFQCDYDTLCDVFGKPQKGDGYKTQVEWEGKTKDGVVFTIYDWKQEIEPSKVKDWHIGGFDYRATEAVNKILDTHYSLGGK